MLEIKSLSIEHLVRGRYQPRRHFSTEELQDLAQSLKQNGFIQPIVVRPIEDERYEIIAGERRWRAAQMATLSQVPCIIQHYNDKEAAQVATVENINRVDLNPIETAMAYQRLLDEFHYTHEDLAGILGKSREKISNTVRLLNLSEKVREFIAHGDLTEGHGKLLLALPEREQYVLAKQCIREHYSVHQLARQIKRKKKTSSEPPSTQQDPFTTAIAEQLGTAVTLEQAGQGGWLKIKYYDNDTLMGLLEKMGIHYES